MSPKGFDTTPNTMGLAQSDHLYTSLPTPDDGPALTDYVPPFPSLSHESLSQKPADQAALKRLRKYWMAYARRLCPEDRQTILDALKDVRETKWSKRGLSKHKLYTSMHWNFGLFIVFAAIYGLDRISFLKEKLRKVYPNIDFSNPVGGDLTRVPTPIPELDPWPEIDASGSPIAKPPSNNSAPIVKAESDSIQGDPPFKRLKMGVDFLPSEEASFSHAAWHQHQDRGNGHLSATKTTFDLSRPRINASASTRVPMSYSSIFGQPWNTTSSTPICDIPIPSIEGPSSISESIPRVVNSRASLKSESGVQGLNSTGLFGPAHNHADRHYVDQSTQTSFPPKQSASCEAHLQSRVDNQPTTFGILNDNHATRELTSAYLERILQDNHNTQDLMYRTQGLIIETQNRITNESQSIRDLVISENNQTRFGVAEAMNILTRVQRDMVDSRSALHSSMATELARLRSRFEDMERSLRGTNTK